MGGTGKAEKITITAEKGRLSEEDIERMVREAEEFAEEDKMVKARIDAKNGLEGYLYNLKNTLDDDEKGWLTSSQRRTRRSSPRPSMRLSTGWTRTPKLTPRSTRRSRRRWRLSPTLSC